MPTVEFHSTTVLISSLAVGVTNIAIQLHRRIRTLIIFGITLGVTTVAQAQIEITEIMYDTSADESVWEWVEVRNTTAAAVDLNGWVFDDDDDSDLSSSNISSGFGNTVVPAGGVAVLYNGDELDFNPSRFTAAWGNGITLIGVSRPNGDSFGGGLGNDGDAIGLWSNFADYSSDLNPGPMGTPRRTFNHAVTSIDYATTNGYPNARDGRSIAWNGAGSPTDPSRWVESLDGELSAGTSQQTVLVGTQLNSTDDRGTPGVPPAGTPGAGLLITEIMYNPNSSPDATWEWVEVYNNTGSLIDFSTTPGLFDDDDDAHKTVENLTTGTIPQGSTAVLFDADNNTLSNMQTAWGAGVNFIPVSSWTGGLSNEGDLVAIWPSLAAYNADALPGPTTPRRGTASASAFVEYDNAAALGWPVDDGNGSIELVDLGADPTVAANWLLSETGSPQPVVATTEDHSGGDVGSPGVVPTVAAVAGDYNENGVVDAADYTVWRDRLGQNVPLPNTDPVDVDGAVTEAEYNFWKSRFGATAASGSLAGRAVPEPASIVLAAIALGGMVRLRRTARPVRY